MSAAVAIANPTIPSKSMRSTAAANGSPEVSPNRQLNICASCYRKFRPSIGAAKSMPTFEAPYAVASTAYCREP